MNARERYLRELDVALQVPGRRRARLLAELRDHFDDAFAAESGTDEQRSDAVWRRLGAPAVVARACNADAGRVATRDSLALVAAVGVGVVGALVVGARTADASASAMSGGWLAGVQVAFFAAVLAAEVATVAWLRSTARVLATWTLPSLSAADRKLVRQCGAVALWSLTVAVGGWSTALVILTWAVHDGLDVGAVVVLAMMITSVVLGWLAWRRLRFNLRDDEPQRIAITTGSSRWWRAEATVLMVIRRWPLAVCAMAAIGTALWVLFNTETPTVADAWPWAAAQAAAVVLGFVGLGARLGLRDSGDLTIVE